VLLVKGDEGTWFPSGNVRGLFEPAGGALCVRFAAAGVIWVLLVVALSMIGWSERSVEKAGLPLVGLDHWLCRPQ
jgi:hypothetical protein